MGSQALPSESAVVEKLRAFLHEADLQTTTERSLQNDLATHFGVAMQGYAELIKSEVAKFISERATQSGSQSSKRPRDEDADIDDPSHASKAPRNEDRNTGNQSQLGSMEGVLTDHALSADGKTRAQVKQFKGNTYVDIRQYWEKGGKLMPSKKGIMLPLGEWQLVEGNLSAARAALQQNDMAFEVQLSSSRRISVNESKSRKYAGIREWYDDGGEMKPGKNGINLDAQMLENLMECATSLSSAAGPAPVTKAPANAGASAAAPSSNSKASTSTAAKAAAKPGSGCKASEPTELQSGTGDTLFQLGGSKFASVSQYKGQWMVGLREFYQKEGAWMPTKKGISLSMDQFRTLCQHEQAVSAALASKDETFSQELSAARKVSISMYKGTTYVNIREYYNKDGNMAPGSKGIALNQEQWNAFTQIVDTLKERTECAW